MGFPMDQVVMTILQEAPDPGQMFGWVQAVFEALGVWTYIQMFVTLSIVLAGVSAFMRFTGK